MAYGYWQSGSAEKEAVFHLFFRKAPFHSGFTVACGLASATEYIQSFCFQTDDLNYLKTSSDSDGKPL
jgi:nicotinate phosphoribosyltransferase